MFCNSFDELSPDKKLKFLGELNHAVQSDEHYYHLAEIIIGLARRKGILDRVKFLSEEEFESSNKISEQ